MEQLIHRWRWIKGVLSCEFQNVGIKQGEGVSLCPAAFLQKVWCHGGDKPSDPLNSGKTYGATEGPSLPWLPLQRVWLLLRFMVKVEGKKKCFTEQIYNLILFFFFFSFLITLGMTSHGRILEWLQGDLGTQWKFYILGFGAFCTCKGQVGKNQGNEPGRWSESECQLV